MDKSSGDTTNFTCAIKKEKLTADLFLKCVENGDSVVQECLLEMADVNQLQELALKGKNKSIRTIAAKKVKELSRQHKDAKL